LVTAAYKGELSRALDWTEEAAQSKDIKVDTPEDDLEPTNSAPIVTADDQNTTSSHAGTTNDDFVNVEKDEDVKEIEEPNKALKKRKGRRKAAAA
jgi:hypothetical protein